MMTAFDRVLKLRWLWGRSRDCCSDKLQPAFSADRGKAAHNQKEILIKHGLLDSVLESQSHSLDQFDQAVGQGTDGRRAHVGASAELDALGEELTQIVRLMDGLNRYRFADDPNSLAEWESASNVVGPVRKAVDTAAVDTAAVDTAAVDTAAVSDAA